MTADDTIHVLFCINNAFAQHCAVAIASLADTEPDSHFDIVIASASLTADNRDKLAQMADRFENLTIRFEQFEGEKLSNFPQHEFYPPDVFMRMWVGEFFPDNVSRAIYLDADMVVRSSLRPLWETPLEAGELIAAVEIFGSTAQERSNLPPDSPYFNSGVMVIDLEKWRKEPMIERLIAFLDEFGHKVRNQDQDALNAVLHGRWRQMDLIWNAITPYFARHDPHGLGKARQQELLTSTRIIHFNGAGKPWFTAVRHPFKKLYWKYLRMTPWADFKAEDDNLMGHLKYWLGPIVSRLRGP